MTSRSEASSEPSTAAVQEASGVEPEGLRPLEVPGALTVSDLANLMGVGPVEVIKEFMRNGYMLTVNEVVEHSIASIVMPMFGFSILSLAEKKDGPRQGAVAEGEEEDADLLEPRPPIVTILGHVDHGKTTLLDTIRQTNVVATEAGNITQHIGAYQVDFNGNPITFVDTPGHEAFTAMRARGAQITDIAVLVVAADDGIMPQTIEAIAHAKAADVPIVVAINKVDKADADLERVKRQLSEHDLLIEEWGGDVVAVPVSALKGDGVTDLLENLLVVAEVAELRANPNRAGKGVVVEARTDKRRGIVATILVQTGKLSVGDNLVAGSIRGRVRAMFDDRGNPVKDVGPSYPVEVLGLDSLPDAGETVIVAPDEKTARQMAETNERGKALRTAGPRLEDVHSRIESGETKALNLIVKTDVQGTIDAVRRSLEGLNSEETRVTVIHASSGGITESDVLLAAASEAIVLGFNSRPEQGARALANQQGVEIRYYDVIYDLIDDVAKALEGLLEPVYEDIVEGRATVRAVFSISRRGNVAGIAVNEGRLARDATIHVLRGGEQIFAGTISSLKHFKDDVRELTTGFEGGIGLEGFDNYQEGDILEAHRSQLAH
ncbi:MAG: translation initiation factor IF-2 [Chloroflexi bacterium]|nr:translation initiation factor IF-2 [Chloroflexota bacterium]